MTNEIKVFESSEFGSVRTVMKDGEPWFVAADVCKALEISDVSTATARLDVDELVRVKTVSGGQTRELNAVNEPGLYSLVLGSRKPEAKAFKRWITHEVIPAIRQHGMYATPQAAEAILSDPDVMIRILEDLKRERASKAELQRSAELNAPKIEFADKVMGSDDLILIGTLAKLLRQSGVNIGEKRLFKKMRDDGYLCKREDGRYNLPTQRALNMGLFKVTSCIIRVDGQDRQRFTTKVTGKGQLFFMNRYT